MQSIPEKLNTAMSPCKGNVCCHNNHQMRSSRRAAASPISQPQLGQQYVLEEAARFPQCPGRGSSSPGALHRVLLRAGAIPAPFTPAHAAKRARDTPHHILYTSTFSFRLSSAAKSLLHFAHISFFLSLHRSSHSSPLYPALYRSSVLFFV